MAMQRVWQLSSGALLRHVAWPCKGFGRLPAEAGEALPAGECCTRTRTKSGPRSSESEQWTGSTSSLVPSNAMLKSAVQQAQLQAWAHGEGIRRALRAWPQVRETSQRHCSQRHSAACSCRLWRHVGLTICCNARQQQAHVAVQASMWRTQHRQKAQDFSPTGRLMSWAAACLPARSPAGACAESCCDLLCPQSACLPLAALLE